MQHSFARIMQEAVHIDYKALYEKERAANVLLHQAVELLKHELAQLKKMGLFYAAFRLLHSQSRPVFLSGRTLKHQLSATIGSSSGLTLLI